MRRNCLLNHLIEGNTEEEKEVTEKGGRGCKQLLNDIKETVRLWTLKEETLVSTVRESCFGIAMHLS